MAASTTDKASFMGSAGFFAGSFLGFGLGFDFVMPHDARAAAILPAAHTSNFTSTHLDLLLACIETALQEGVVGGTNGPPATTNPLDYV